MIGEGKEVNTVVLQGSYKVKVSADQHTTTPDQPKGRRRRGDSREKDTDFSSSCFFYSVGGKSRIFNVF